MPHKPNLWTIPCLFLSFFMSGCVNSNIRHYSGISPVIDAVSVEQSSHRINNIIDALAKDTGNKSYYEITEAGFNYIDDQCMEYFGELFFLNRRREATKAGLNAFGQTTNAILAASGASGLSMAVVAQAFGFASNITDIAAGTYLYQLPPATTLSFVRKLQGAYREGVAAKAGQIGSPTTAYRLIQDYLSLCLPAVIEAKLIEHVADAAAVPVRSGSVANVGISVLTNSARLPSRTASTTIPDVRQPATYRNPRSIPQPGTIGSFEPTLLAPTISNIQRSLCVVPATGKINDATRMAVDEFFRGIRDGASTRTYPSAASVGLQGVHMDKLLQAIEEVQGQCSPQQHKNAFEIGKRLS